MAGYADKLEKAASGVLRPGEKVLGAIRTQPRGSVTGAAVGGLIGTAVADRQAKKAREGMGEGTVAASWPSGKLAFGLTDQRVLAFNFTAMGKPKDLQTEIPLDQVADIRLGKAKITKAVQVEFTDGSAIELECGKLEKVDDFISAFKGAKGSAS
jgi:hypothetical protein